MESIIGIKKCDAMYWVIQGAFVLICVLFTFIAVKLAQRDQALKIKYGNINITDSDIRYDNKKKLT